MCSRMILNSSMDLRMLTMEKKREMEVMEGRLMVLPNVSRWTVISWMSLEGAGILPVSISHICEKKIHIRTKTTLAYAYIWIGNHEPHKVSFSVIIFSKDWVVDLQIE